jgi:UDP-N-acetylglucosamine 2-epimerase
MLDALLATFDRIAGRAPQHLAGLPVGGFYLATVHRAENTDAPDRLRAIFEAFSQLPLPVLVPLHPRTRKILAQTVPTLDPRQVRVVEPFGYFDMISAISSSRGVLTDSGGLQKEAFWLGRPCLILRDQTEWGETLRDGYNCLAGADLTRIVAGCRALPPSRAPLWSGAGAARRSAEILAGAIF